MKYSPGFIIVCIVMSLMPGATVSGKTPGPSILEPLTVTARKQNEDIRKVPVSMDAFSNLRLEKSGIESIRELTRFSPNVYMKYSTFGNVAVIRGISSFDTSLYGPVGFYVDDVSHPMHFAHNPDLFDIERVEILKGPQGTLYGRNSESGVINVITRKPGNMFHGSVSGEYSFFDNGHGSRWGGRALGNVKGPLVRDKLYFGVAALHEDAGGFRVNRFDNDDHVDEIDQMNLRGSLRWTPQERWDITLTADYTDTDDGTGFYRFYTGPGYTERYTVKQDEENTTSQELRGQVLRISYQADGFEILSVTGFRDFQQDFTNDFDCTPQPLGYNDFDIGNRFFSEEVRIVSSDPESGFSWVVGFFGFHEDNTIVFNMERKMAAMASRRRTDIDVDGTAVFGQGTLRIFERWHLTTGIRVDHLEQDGHQRLAQTGAARQYGREMEDTEVLPKISLAYDLNENTILYASWSQGYLAGGYSYHFATGADTLVYAPEYTLNYEMGIKSSWWNDRVTADLSCFYIDMDDKQITEYLPGGMRQISNAAAAHSMGLEAAVTARPVQRLEIDAGFGYTDAEIDDWVATEYATPMAPPTTYDYGDKRLPNVPRYTYNFGIQYMTVNGIFSRADLLGVGDLYFDAKNRMKSAAYCLVNLRFGYTWKQWDLAVWGKNIFDTAYETIKVNWSGNELGQDGDPRQIGVTATWRF